MSNKHISLRLIIMNFLQYAIWGAYLTSMGSFLGKAGLPCPDLAFLRHTGIRLHIYASPDRHSGRPWIPAQKTLSLCQLIAGVSMLGTGLYAMGNVYVRRRSVSGRSGLQFQHFLHPLHDQRGVLHADNRPYQLRGLRRS